MDRLTLLSNVATSIPAQHYRAPRSLPYGERKFKLKLAGLLEVKRLRATS